MPSLQETLDFVVRDADRCFSTKRKSPNGSVENVETSFDHALTVLKLFELTRDSQHLQRWMDFVYETAELNGGHARWNFSSSVTDIPPDADSTAMNLLLLTMAEKNGISIPDGYSPLLNLPQFKNIADDSGGIKTYFGQKQDNDADPIVNTAIMFLYILNHSDNICKQEIRRYLKREAGKLLKNPNVSKYYVGGAYFAERMAKLSTYDPKTLDEGTAKVLDEFLLTVKPENTLQAALLSIGSAHRGLSDRAAQLNHDLEARRKNGLWRFGTFYRQRTPRFSYGHERLTALFSLEALKIEENGFRVKTIDY